MFPDVPTFKDKGYDVFPYGPLVQMAYVVAPANLPADVRTKLITAFRAAIQDPRFKEFAKKNAFLVDDLTGDALTKEVDSVADALGTVGGEGLQGPEKNKRQATPPCPSHIKTKATRLPIKKITCHVVAAPVAAALHLLARLALQDARHLPGRDRDRRRHRRLGRMLRALGRRQGLHRHPVQGRAWSAAIRSTSR